MPPWRAGGVRAAGTGTESDSSWSPARPRRGVGDDKRTPLVSDRVARGEAVG
jgi:hypothetical protein